MHKVIDKVSDKTKVDNIKGYNNDDINKINIKNDNDDINKIKINETDNKININDDDNKINIKNDGNNNNEHNHENNKKVKINSDDIINEEEKVTVITIFKKRKSKNK